MNASCGFTYGDSSYMFQLGTLTRETDPISTRQFTKPASHRLHSETMSRVYTFFLILCLTIIGQYANGNSIRNVENVSTKDIPVTKDEGTALNESNRLETPVDVEETPVKTCAPIGEFCVYHTDCCTKSCLGYMRKCVS
ncbi:hypothetical protein K1T71_006556 [Dendrolimus kikuchii]|uniref:Uncharacterized protein n=1 Tax=Dendrolimus kikuchii TaxID=765133 RepID=A0ACC1D172_9NEOP|nr:hypothetical protein K1T71_006556 [Dendrolimus kikuchii]